MADKKGKKLRVAMYCRIGNPKDAEPCHAEKLPGRKGADADAHKESCDIREGIDRA